MLDLARGFWIVTFLRILAWNSDFWFGIDKQSTRQMEATGPREAAGL